GTGHVFSRFVPLSLTSGPRWKEQSGRAHLGPTETWPLQQLLSLEFPVDFVWYGTRLAMKLFSESGWDRGERVFPAAGSHRVVREPSGLLGGLGPILGVGLALPARLGRQRLAHGLELLAAESPPRGPLGLVLVDEGGMDLADLAALLVGDAEPV